MKGTHAGCRVLAAELKKLHRCRLHVFGHIHEAYGASRVEKQDLIHVNAAMIHAPCAIIVDLRDSEDI
jgi:Icc-related predicted phosphoesterase